MRSGRLLICDILFDQCGHLSSTIGMPERMPRKCLSGGPTLRPPLAHAEFANGLLVIAAALLHDGDGLVQLAFRLVVAQQDHAVGEVADVDGRDHVRADQSVLRHRPGSSPRPLVAEVREHLVQVQREEALLGHGVEVAVQAVDDDDSRVVLLDRLADEVRELAGSKLRGIDLLRGDQLVLQRSGQVHADRRGTFEQAAPALVEDEQRGTSRRVSPPRPRIASPASICRRRPVP